MTKRSIVAISAVTLLVTACACAQDWPGWRGPARNGIVVDSPPLVDTFGKEGPKRLWLSEPLMGEDAERFGTGKVSSPGGEGSISVAAGRAYVCVNMNVDVPTAERRIDVKRFGTLQRLSWNPDLPKEYADAIEAARFSDARRKLKSETEIRSWTNGWIKENEKPGYRKYRAFVTARLKEDPEALPFDVMKKLLTIRNRTFASQAELDRWYDANGIDQTSRKCLTERNLIQTSARKGRDLLCCLDAQTGKRIWTAELSGSWMHYVCAFTPTVSGGRVYALTSAAVAYCLDVKTGEVIWQSVPLGKPRHEHNRSSSALVVNGLVVVGTDTGCHALDARTGEVRWHNAEAGDKEASPVAWTVGGATRILSIGNATGRHRLYALDAADGKVLWSIPGKDETFANWRGDFRSTPAVVDNHLAFCGGSKLGLVAYALDGEQPVKLWQTKMHDAYASPIIHDGHVYYIGGNRATCVELASGKIAWQKRLPGDARLSSPVLADGKLFAVTAPRFVVIKADPERYQLLATANLRLPKWTSPTIADGRLYLRVGKSVACYDLRR